MMSNELTDLVAEALDRAVSVRPAVDGFPHFAEALRLAGISALHCDLPSGTTTYRTAHGAVIHQPPPLMEGLASIPAFDRDALIDAIRRDQRGEWSYEQFLRGAWAAGVTGYDVDLDGRTCTYCGTTPAHDVYVESYPPVAGRG